MKKVKIIGKLKKLDGKKIVVSSYEKEGWLKDGKIFYPDKENTREFYKVIDCKVCWNEGILIKEIKEIKEKEKKEEVIEEAREGYVRPEIAMKYPKKRINKKKIKKEEIEKQNENK